MFKLAKLSDTQLKSLSPKLKEEVVFVKDNTENYDKDYFEIFAENDARLYKLVEQELAKQPKEKSTPSPKAAPKKEKTPKSSTPKKKEAPQPKASEPTPKKTAETAVFSHRRKVPEDILQNAKKVNLTCEFYTFTAEKDMTVEVKTSVKKGEHLLVHKDRYLFAAMTESGFSSRCQAVKTPPKEIAKPAKKEAPKAKKTTKPEFIQIILDNPPVPLLTWLDGQIELWKNRQTNQKISKIMVFKESGEIILEITHFDKILRVADLRLTYHRIDSTTTKLTKITAPKKGTYRLLVSKAELKEQYATNRNWTTCRAWVKEAYECSRAGNCSTEQKELFKKYYHQCGDLVAKEENIEYLKWLHLKAGEIWNRGEETYLEAFGRSVEMLKNNSYL